MRIVYQLHLKGKNRGKHNFKSEDEAMHHQGRLIKHCKDLILSGQLGYQGYLKEARALEIVRVELKDTSRTYSIVENTFRGSGVVRNYFDAEEAEEHKVRLQQSSARHYAVMETFVNVRH